MFFSLIIVFFFQSSEHWKALVLLAVELTHAFNLYPVFCYHSDWNPQNDIQAMARCHRIGQKKHVTIYRLIPRRSFEAEMFERASKKLGLEQAVLGTRNFTEVPK